MTPEGGSELERAAQEADAGFVGEFWEFLRENKKWWLLPLIVVLLLVGLLLMFGGGAVAPFIYTIF